MFWFRLKKRLEKLEGDIKDSFRSAKKDIKNNSKQLHQIEINLAELKGQFVREQPIEIPRTNTKHHKKAIKFADKVVLVSEIKAGINKGLSKVELYNLIVTRKGICKKTCFYKHYKIVRDMCSRTSANDIISKS